MPKFTESLAAIRQIALERLRGEPNLKRLVAAGLELGVETHIARPLYIDAGRPWLITIDDYANIAPYVAIITHDATLHNHTGLTRIGRVVVGKRVSVGVGAILLPGTILGEDSVVGAGAVVQGDIPPGSLVVGNPAKASPIKAAAAWQRASARSAPSWPLDGWSIDSGITDARKREQRESLAGAASGYVPAKAAPGSPHTLKSERS